MIRTTYILIALVLCTLSFLTYTATSIKDVVVPEEANLLRVQAGTINRYGWYKAQSASRRFLVEFPAHFQEWEAVVDSQTSPTMSLGTTSSNGTKYLVTEFQKPTDLEFKNLTSFVRQFFEGQHRSSTRNITYRGINGKEVLVNRLNTSTVYHFLFTDDYIYQLSVEYTKVNQSVAVKKARVFFNTFRLINKTK